MEKIAFIGAGAMSEAIIAGLVENNLINHDHIFVTNHSNEARLNNLEKMYNVTGTYNMDDLLTDTNIVVLAMMPKDIKQVMEKINPFLTENMLIVSVLAGVKIDTIEQLANKRLSIARAMPNTSAAIQQSVTALALNNLVTKKQTTQLEAIFNTIGFITTVEEHQLDIITGISGSGPAYIYYIIEALENVATEFGLDDDIAKQLIVQTIIGAANMVAKSDKPAQQLRKEVASPGGTTEAGLKVLQSYNVQEAFINCVKEATAQSKRLGKANHVENNS